MASNTSRDGDDKEIEHKIERQTWVSEYEIYELSDDGELVVSHAEKRGPVKNQKTLECSCGQRFRKDRTAREHLEEVTE